MSISNALKWSVLSEVASKAINPLALIVLARLLTPEDFGVVAAATMVISFSQIFWEAGIGKALIQYRGDREAAANTGFWMNVVLGMGVAAILATAADVVAEKVFHDGRVAGVLQIMSVQVILSSLSSVHAASLQKDMRFKTLFWVRLATTAAPALLSIPIAWMGAGFWALVWGALLGQATQAVMLWRMTKWRPKASFDAVLARRLTSFSSWVIVSGLSGWFYLWADALIVGMHMGSHELGMYRTGNTFVALLMSTLVGPILPVLYSHLSRVDGGRAEVARILGDVVRLIVAITLPSAFLLFALSEPVSALVFGASWQGIDEVVAVLALAQGVAWMVGANGEAYRAIGRPAYEAMAMAGTLPIYCLAYWVSIQYGLTEFLWTRFGLAMFGVFVQLWIAKAVLGFPVARVLGYAAKTATVGVPLILVGAYRGRITHQEIRDFILPAMSVVWVAAFVWWMERDGLIPMILRNFRGKAKARSVPGS